MVRVEMSFLNSELWKGKYFDVCYSRFAYAPVPLDFLKLWNKWEAKANFYEGEVFLGSGVASAGMQLCGQFGGSVPSKAGRVVPPNGFVYAVVLRKPRAVWLTADHYL